MEMKSTNIKLVLAAIYLLLIIVAASYLIGNYNISDFFSYEFIRINKNTILEYRKENFLSLTIIFFIFCVVWVLLLGFAMPLLIFAGFVFGKWWGILIVIISTSIGALLLYMLANLFFRKIIEEKFAPKFAKLKKLFNKNELIYFMCFRFVGGGGTPYAIQNILPVLFNMSLKNYFIATFVGSIPSMFVSVALGSGIESVIDQNVEINILTVLFSSEIYIPIIGFFIILIIAYIVRKIYFKKYL
jgi:uncharacterized membrane protein YdjX (TVP38/TMEM64 family)